VMGDRPSTTPWSTINSMNVPDTYDNNLEISDSDDEGTKEVNSQMLAITDTSSIVQKSSQMKWSAKGVQYLKKSRNLLLAAYHPNQQNYRC